jgi:hypothetical protein
MVNNGADGAGRPSPFSIFTEKMIHPSKAEGTGENIIFWGTNIFSFFSANLLFRAIRGINNYFADKNFTDLTNSGGGGSLDSDGGASVGATAAKTSALTSPTFNSSQDSTSQDSTSLDSTPLVASSLDAASTATTSPASKSTTDASPTLATTSTAATSIAAPSQTTQHPDATSLATLFPAATSPTLATTSTAAASLAAMCQTTPPPAATSLATPLPATTSLDTPLTAEKNPFLIADTRILIFDRIDLLNIIEMSTDKSSLLGSTARDYLEKLSQNGRLLYFKIRAMDVPKFCEKAKSLLQKYPLQKALVNTILQHPELRHLLICDIVGGEGTFNNLPTIKFSQNLSYLCRNMFEYKHLYFEEIIHPFMKGIDVNANEFLIIKYYIHNKKDGNPPEPNFETVYPYNEMITTPQGTTYPNLGVRLEGYMFWQDDLYDYGPTPYYLEHGYFIKRRHEALKTLYKTGTFTIESRRGEQIISLDPPSTP